MSLDDAIRRARIEDNTVRWRFDGVMGNEGFTRAATCPVWVWFLNWASDGQRLIVHGFGERLVVQLGQTLCRAPDGRMWIEA
jgi:hypothetical protein